MTAAYEASVINRSILLLTSKVYVEPILISEEKAGAIVRDVFTDEYIVGLIGTEGIQSAVDILSERGYVE